MKKRLWWSILLRDRSLCIGLRRRPQITNVNIHECCEWLTEQDFREEMYHSPFFDFKAKQTLLAAFQEQCQLAVLLTDLISLIFAPRVTSATSPTARESFYTLATTINKIKRSMIDWETHIECPPILSGELELHEPTANMRHLTFMYYQ